MLRNGQLRSLASAQLSAGESFYLAIKRTDSPTNLPLRLRRAGLPRRGPGRSGRHRGHARGLLRIQNDKLFLFDASDINATSDVFDPTLVLEAWPIVTNSDTFNRDAEKDRYVLIDPAAGLNRFNMFADYYYQPPQFHVGLSYLQNYKKLPDGMSFQQVFTGEATEPVHDIYGNEYNLNRISTGRCSARHAGRSSGSRPRAGNPSSP